MMTVAWFFIIFLFVWVVILQNKTSDMEVKINFLTNRLKGVEKHLSNNKDKKEQLVEPANPVIEPEIQPEDETENTEEYIDDIGIIKNTHIEKEKDTIKSINYNNNITNEKNEDFEHVFLGRISYIIGAIAIIIACCIFIGLIQGLIPPMFKAVIALFIGIGMIIFGLNIKKESLIKYSEGLIGTGFAVIFITIYCATALTHTFSYALCTILGILALIAAYIIADKQKTVSMIAIALIGGYFNVFMVSDNVALNNIFIYLIFLNILSMAFVIKNADKYVINYINLIATFIFAENMYLMDNPLSFIYPVILWLIYQIYDIVLAERAENYDPQRYFHWINYAVLSLFSFVIFKEDTMKIGLVQFYLTIPYCIFSWYFKSKESPNYRLYLNNLLLCLFPATYFLVKGCARTGVYSLIAIILSIVVNKLDKDYLAKWATGFISVAIISVFILNKDMFYIFDAANYHPIVNFRTLALLSTILASFVSYFEFRETKSDMCNNLSNYMKFCGITLIYILISFETGDYILFATKGYSSAILISTMTYAIICSIYSVQMRKLSITTNCELFRIVSYIAGILSLVLLFSGGLEYKPIESFIPVFNIRFIAFATATAIAAYMSKHEKTDILKYLAVILGFTLITIETADFTRHIAANGMNYLVSVVWTIYAGIILAIGIFKDKKFLKMSGIWAIILTVIKILFFDMAQVNFLYKMIVFIILGVVLMIISYYYNKLQK